MDISVMVISWATAGLLVFTLIGGPMVLADRVWRRRQAVIARQIELTDALDAEFGALVAPVVRKPLFGPWEVRIDVPLLGSAVLARILAVTDAVFAGVKGRAPMRYRLVLGVTSTPWREAAHRRVRRPATHWPGTAAA